MDSQRKQYSSFCFKEYSVLFDWMLVAEIVIVVQCVLLLLCKYTSCLRNSRKL